MCSGHKLLPVDGGMPPLVKDSVENVHDGVVAANCSCAICTSNSVMAVGVAHCGAGCTVCAFVGAWPRLENEIVHPSADADIEDCIGHIVAWGRRELEPRAAM